ncbi:MAG: segregation/condensation protein A [Planctomycetota bacterium]|nr:segregation/condensation protein A [Planctomycetota bacterium]MDI6788504.1 segregation/condensation protein A [Planctomycetota bacterium]
MEIINYKIQLENFYGPLDLLLYLVRENELDPLKIPVTRITEQYLNYLEMMRKLDINLAGEFLVMATTLMEIKARLLVPPLETDEEEQEEQDPRFELIRRLLEYKKYKDLAGKLRVLVQLQALTFPRRPYDETEQTGEKAPESGQEAPAETQPPTPEIELDIWQLMKSFARISKEIVLDTPTSILYDDIPIEKIIEWIMNELRQKGEILFSNLAGNRGGGTERINIVRNFLATLELARRSEIEIRQENDFADIRIKLSRYQENPDGTS